MTLDNYIITKLIFLLKILRIIYIFFNVKTINVQCTKYDAGMYYNNFSPEVTKGKEASNVFTPIWQREDFLAMAQSFTCTVYRHMDLWTYLICIFNYDKHISTHVLLFNKPKIYIYTHCDIIRILFINLKFNCSTPRWSFLCIHSNLTMKWTEFLRNCLTNYSVIHQKHRS